jgi:hypothetical protein
MTSIEAENDSPSRSIAGSTKLFLKAIAEAGSIVFPIIEIDMPGYSVI